MVRGNMLILPCMNPSRQLNQMLKASLTGLSILVFCLSLVLPYSSAYYSQDSRVSQKQTTSVSDEKVEISTSLLASPAECLNTKIVQRFQSLDRAILVHPRLIVVFLKSHSFPAGFTDSFSSRLLPWRPSIVIALRRLII